MAKKDVCRTVELSILATARPFPIATQCTYLTATYTKHSFDVFSSNIAMARPFLAKCLPLTKVKTEKLCKNICQLLCYLFSFFATVNFVACLFVYYGFYNLFLVSV